MDIDNPKIPPNSVDSEQSVLGGLLLHNESWDSVVNILSSDDFYQTSHRIIYDAIVTLLEHDKPADILTVKEQVIKSHDEDSIGGFTYLAQIAENTPSVSNIEAYAKHVRELSIFRQLIKIGKEMADNAFSPKNIEVNDLLDLSERKIFEIAEQVSRNKQEITNVKDIIKDVVNRVHEMQELKGYKGAETGFSEFDKLTSGLQNGDLIIIAGRPSMGKTALSMNIVEHVAIHNSTPVAVFSLEMPTEQLVIRMISSFGRIDSSKLRDGDMSEIDWNSFNHAVRAFEENTILIDETPSITPTEIRAKCRRLKRRYPDLGLIMVDYLQLMTVHGKSENRVQEISNISRTLKAIAKELDVPVLALSQLSRAVEMREDKRPNLSDLRESGSIEQDADVVMFVYREEYYLNKREPEQKMEESVDTFNIRHADWLSKMQSAENKAEIIVAKQRHGPTGSVNVHFEKRFTHFTDLTESTHLPEGF